ncbi:Transmembrane protein 70, mitochondrial [Chionoecetes opilio]|uniref:Transmembrane protein 70, mitochondrial n=1 Tax=Chionoecetes opilio TaxID=41210 RepID=A0A8J4YTS1_CHIOP|nr:Transmembrane protein 70, mitochondrial [Chionoecetes opilio]
MKEIYHGILSTQIKMVKFFSLSTSMLGLSVQPILFTKVLGTNAGILVAAGSFFGVLHFVTPLLIHWITKKYVTSLEYAPRQRSVLSHNTLFLPQGEEVDDVKVPEVPGMFTPFLIKNRPMFWTPDMFKERDHYGRLRGYDRAC